MNDKRTAEEIEQVADQVASTLLSGWVPVGMTSEEMPALANAVRQAVIDHLS